MSAIPAAGRPPQPRLDTRLRVALGVSAAAAALVGATGLSQGIAFASPSTLKYALTVGGPLLVLAAVVSQDPVRPLAVAAILAAPFAGFTATFGSLSMSPLVPLLVLGTGAALVSGPATAAALCARDRRRVGARPPRGSDRDGLGGLALRCLAGGGGHDGLDRLAGRRHSRAAWRPSSAPSSRRPPSRACSPSGSTRPGTSSSSTEALRNPSSARIISSASPGRSGRAARSTTRSRTATLSRSPVPSLCARPRCALRRGCGSELRSPRLSAPWALSVSLSRMSWRRRDRRSRGRGLAVSCRTQASGNARRWPGRCARRHRRVPDLGGGVRSSLSSISEPTSANVATAGGDRQRIELGMRSRRHGCRPSAVRCRLRRDRAGARRPCRHNRVRNPRALTYLQLLAEGGLAAVLALLLVFGATMRSLRDALRGDRHARRRAVRSVRGSSPRRLVDRLRHPLHTGRGHGRRHLRRRRGAGPTAGAAA